RMASCGGSASLDVLGTDACHSQAGDGTLSTVAMDAYPAAGFLLYDIQGASRSLRRFNDRLFIIIQTAPGRLFHRLRASGRDRMDESRASPRVGEPAVSLCFVDWGRRE